ncbi:hypothetical protein [Calothrix sp. CCY 0018]|uniref:hypothetical protein n=1 Tax=Calothrix sp. CCY 0018 TaxID=3103864 RepID=UPI0039C645E4
MSINCLEKPKFYLQEKVSFLGGTGKIKNLQREAGSWIYTVEMSMGLEPDFGRIGAETTILLEEQDIHNGKIDVN